MSQEEGLNGNAGEMAGVECKEDHCHEDHEHSSVSVSGSEGELGSVQRASSEPRGEDRRHGHSHGGAEHDDHHGHHHSHGASDHGHSHGADDEGHGHSHEGHGHSHEGHGHSHEGHGHSHGSDSDHHPHSHSHGVIYDTYDDDDDDDHPVYGGARGLGLRATPRRLDMEHHSPEPSRPAPSLWRQWLWGIDQDDEEEEEERERHLASDEDYNSVSGAPRSLDMSPEKRATRPEPAGSPAASPPRPAPPPREDDPSYEELDESEETKAARMLGAHLARVKLEAEEREYKDKQRISKLEKEKAVQQTLLTEALNRVRDLEKQNTRKYQIETRDQWIQQLDALKADRQRLQEENATLKEKLTKLASIEEALKHTSEQDSLMSKATTALESERKQVDALRSELKSVSDRLAHAEAAVLAFKKKVDFELQLKWERERGYEGAEEEDEGEAAGGLLDRVIQFVAPYPSDERSS